jgi:hypothetical protein
VKGLLWLAAGGAVCHHIVITLQMDGMGWDEERERKRERERER